LLSLYNWATLKTYGTDSPNIVGSKKMICLLLLPLVYIGCRIWDPVPVWKNFWIRIQDSGKKHPDPLHCFHICNLHTVALLISGNLRRTLFTWCRA
jgi:hypothetical protein